MGVGGKLFPYLKNGIMHQVNSTCMQLNWLYAEFTNLPRLSQGVPRGGQICKKCAKMANLRTYGLNYWETVEDRWVYAARRFTSIYLQSFVALTLYMF